jgi:hypothetical protein
MPLTPAEAPPLTGRIGLHHISTSEDSIIQSDLPQLPIDFWNVEVGQILGRVGGRHRDMGASTLITESGIKTIFSKTVQTQFVRVQLIDGSERMEPYNPKRHKEWDAIPDIGVLPDELVEQLRGFGFEEMDQSQQFTNARKKGASKENWPVNHYPKPRQK